MRAYATLCESTKFYASLAGLCEATFCASCASSHAKSYATTSLNKSESSSVFLNLIVTVRVSSVVSRP